MVQKCLCLFYKRKEATPWELGSSCYAMYGPSNGCPACTTAVSGDALGAACMSCGGLNRVRVNLSGENLPGTSPGGCACPPPPAAVRVAVVSVCPYGHIHLPLYRCARAHGAVSRPGSATPPAALAAPPQLRPRGTGPGSPEHRRQHPGRWACPGAPAILVAGAN